MSATVDSETCAFVGRSHSGAPGSVRLFLSAPAVTSNLTVGSQSTFPNYPYVGNGGLLYGSIDLLEGPFTPRGYLPGVYAPIHRRPFPEQTIVSDVDGLPLGTRLLAKNVTADNMAGFADTWTGQILIDITNSWG